MQLAVDFDGAVEPDAGRPKGAAVADGRADGGAVGVVVDSLPSAFGLGPDIGFEEGAGAGGRVTTSAASGSATWVSTDFAGSKITTPVVGLEGVFGGPADTRGSSCKAGAFREAK